MRVLAPAKNSKSNITILVQPPPPAGNGPFTLPIMHDAPIANEGGSPDRSAVRPGPAPRRRRLRGRLSTGHVVMIAAGLAAFLLNLLILRGGDETVPAAVAARPLPAGARLAERDLEEVRIAAGGALARRALAPEEAAGLVGRALVRDVGAGAPLFPDDFRPFVPGAGRAMSIPVPPGRAVAAELRSGDRVDVVSAGRGWGRFAATGVEVLSVTEDGDGLGGGELNVIVAVDGADALAVAAALADSEIFLVRSTGAPPAPALSYRTPPRPGEEPPAGPSEEFTEAGE